MKKATLFLTVLFFLSCTSESSETENDTDDFAEKDIATGADLEEKKDQTEEISNEEEVIRDEDEIKDEDEEKDVVYPDQKTDVDEEEQIDQDAELILCEDSTVCEKGYYCFKDEGECGLEGFCKKKPSSCPSEKDEVCGCDGLVYSNDCNAVLIGNTSVKKKGQCGKPDYNENFNFCQDASECEDNQYCFKADGTCQEEGICMQKLSSCPDDEDVVCGCNGEQYKNRCYAIMAGTSVNYSGECR